MAIKKIINVEVNTGDSVQELDKLEKGFKDVDKQAEKTDSQLKQVGDNGGAIAILDSLTGGMATRMRDAAEATKLFNFSLKGTRTALIATGIGALVVALGFIVAYWDDIVEFVTQANAKLEEQLVNLQSQEGALKASLKQNELLEKSLIAQGKSTKQILEQRDKILQSEQLLILAQIQNLRQQRAILKAKAEELSLSQKIGESELRRAGIDLGDVKGDVTDEEKKGLADLDLQIQELTNSLIELGLGRDAIFNDEKGITGITQGEEPQKDTQEDFNQAEAEEVTNMQVQSEQDRLLRIQEVKDFYYVTGLEREIADIERKAQADIDELVSLGAQKEAIEAIEQASSDKIAALVNKSTETSAKTSSDTEVKWSELTSEAKLGIAKNILGGVAGLIDKQSIAGRGIAVAQTGINTAQGIMQAFATLPTIPAAIAAALVGTTGILQTKKILSEKIPSATGRGFVSGGSSGSSVPSAPSFNLVEGTEGNQISEDLQGIGSEPTRAYVVSSDVTTGQELDRNIVEESGI